MKNILWTSLFWILVVLFFAGFLKWGDDGKMTNFMNSYILNNSVEECIIPQSTGEINTGDVIELQISESIDAMQIQIEEMTTLMETLMERNFNEDISSVFYKEEQEKKSETMLKIEALEKELSNLKNEVK